MDAHAAILLSLIQTLEHFERHVEGITTSNHKQIAKAQESVRDIHSQRISPRYGPIRQSRPFSQ
jgi:hypothetical protein